MIPRTITSRGDEKLDGLEAADGWTTGRILGLDVGFSDSSGGDAGDGSMVVPDSGAGGSAAVAALEAATNRVNPENNKIGTDIILCLTKIIYLIYSKLPRGLRGAPAGARIGPSRTGPANYTPQLIHYQIFRFPFDICLC